MEKSISKSYIKKALIALSIILIVLMSLICAFKKYFSYSIIEDYFFNFTGLKLELVEPKTKLGAHICFKADTISIFDENKKTRFVYIQNPDIDFKPFSFLFKKINIKSLNARSIEINLNRNEKGIFDIVNSIKKQKDEKEFKNNFKDFKIVRFNSDIKNIKISLKDDFHTKSTTTLNLDNSIIKKSKKSFIINEKGTVETIINSKKEISNIDIKIDSENYYEANIDNINLHIFSSLFEKYLSNDILNVYGNANISIINKTFFIEIDKIIFNLKNNKNIIPYSKNIVLKGLFDFDKNTFEIKQSKLLSDKLDIEAFGTIKNINSDFKNTDFDFDVQINNTELNNLAYFLPDGLIYYNPRGIKTLKETGFFGILNGRLKINSSIKPVCVEGYVKATNIRILSAPKAYRPNDVNALFMKDKVKIHTKVYSYNNEYVLIDGISNLDDSLYGEYSIESSQNVDLKYAQDYLIPIQRIIGFNLGPVPIMKLSGFGNINIKTKGTIEDARIFGEFRAHNAIASIKGIDAILKNGSARLIFDDRNLIFKEIKGTMQNADFLLTGIGDTKGNMDVDVKIKDIRAIDAINIFKTSELSKPYKSLLDNVAGVSSNINAFINLKGNNLLNEYESDDFLSKLKLKGSLDFKNNKIILNNSMFVKNLNGNFSFGDSQSANLNFNIGNSQNSKFNFSFKSKTPLENITKGEDIIFDSYLKSSKAEFQDILDEIKNIKNNDRINYLKFLDGVNFLYKIDTKHQGKININNINPNDIKISGYILGLNSGINKNIKFNSGIIKLEDNKINFNNFQTVFNQGNMKITGNIKDYLTTKPIGDLNIDIENINLKKMSEIIPKVKFSETTLKKGKITFKNTALKLNSFSIDVEKMPLYLDAQIRNIYDKNSALETNFSALLNEKTMDSIVNPYLDYPIKIKGETLVKGTFKGDEDNYDLNFALTIPKDCDISFSGANLGDVDIKRQILGKIKVHNNILKIDNIRLVKYIKNQNNKTNPLVTLKANGEIIQKNKKMYYNNFKISTNTPINVRILNLVFKKSLLKKGSFECLINLTGDIKSPKPTGKIVFQDLDIPLYDTQINDIRLNIEQNDIIGQIDAKSAQSDLTIDFTAQNSFETPYVIDSVDIQSTKLDISQILKSVSVQTNKTDIAKKQDIAIKPDDIIVKKGSFHFKDVNYDKITAKNLKGNFDYKNNLFNLKDIIFEIAKGQIIAKGTYSINSTKLNLNAAMENCEANLLTKDFLKMQDQIFGKVNGSMTLSAKNLNTPQGIKTLKSEVTFSINEGKMPKLGSLEYLLSAGNLIKNGILGLSLNNIIQILTPYKTGEFEKISGTLLIKGGEVQDIEILSKGKNLSLYLNGNYSILENFADIDIYGRLSKNVSNALVGKVANASIAQFISSIPIIKNKNSNKIEENLQKIPSVENESENTSQDKETKAYFKVKVLGDINKDNYIKSFSWQ